ncbi:cobyrinate a,c-diamide synthase [Desulfonema magnum]|uniref:Cobyrinate a,c-diamide synthase n=1 Tax=Desulfonema magnum TaxID=45655 RepID=A0A975BTV5_9BACT|nr:cobyrinate a,c-diamide synthase [Desulfonema magnum]QTA91030.1 NAD-dependent protein deacylase [Desulfonema magnum]
MKQPRIIFSALRGGSGKTLISLGSVAALRSQGLSVRPFKKGPDYIDAGWLAFAAGKSCYNLDTFMVNPDDVLKSFLFHTSENDIAVIEGNRGLYDGIDTEGATSTAELAKLLNVPVVLCIDCTKSTRTMAAAVLGCIHFDPDVNIKGVVLNRVAGPRHENILRKSMEQHCGVPVIGAVPKLSKQNLPERHMGLVPTPEHEWAAESIDAASRMAKKYLDIDALTQLAHSASEIPAANDLEEKNRIVPKNLVFRHEQKPKIGIIRDTAFQFYYPENIEALVSAGAEPVFLSPLSQKSFPYIDALYIGGGFPETHAKELAENISFREELKVLAEKGLPIYAECGGLMYLGEKLVLDGKSYPMAGVLPIVFGFSKKPQGHGYTLITVAGENPYFKVGTRIRGHEFHYSKVLEWRGEDEDLVFAMKRGAGFINNRDGICYKNVLATYTHIHALGMPSWGEAMVRNAIVREP